MYYAQFRAFSLTYDELLKVLEAKICSNATVVQKEYASIFVQGVQWVSSHDVDRFVLDL